MTEKGKISIETKKAIDLFETEKFIITAAPDYEDVMNRFRIDSQNKHISFNQIFIAILFIINIISAVAVYTYTSDTGTESRDDTFQKEYYLNYSNYYYLI